MEKEFAILTLYYIPSPFGIDWTSPTSLARSIIKNKFGFKKRFMGHVNIELEYSDGTSSFLTGISGNTKSSPKLLLKDGMGLGILYHSYDGGLEDEKELNVELGKYFNKGNKSINFSRYKINLEAANRIEKYLSIIKEKNLDRYYGLINNPLRGEGSGCSAFGASFLRVAGIMTDEYQKNCSHNVTLPSNLCGSPLRKNKVNFLKMLTNQYNWGDPEIDHTLHFWDPDLMHTWVQKKLTEHNQNSDFKIVNIDNSKGIEYDCTQIPCPKGDIFKIEPIESNLPNLDIKNNQDIYCE